MTAKKLTKNQSTTVDAYAVAFLAKIEAEKVMKKLKPEVEKVVESRGGNISRNGLVLCLEKSTRYRYSDDVSEANALLTEMRKKEVEDGIADLTESTRLTCKVEK